MKKIISCLAVALLLVALSMKANAQLDSLWSRTYGGNAIETCSSIIQTQNGGFAMGGYTASFDVGRYDFWILRSDENGDSLWSRPSGGVERDVCWSIKETNEGNLVMVGETWSSGAGNNDFWLLELNDRGEEIWSRTYGTVEGEQCLSCTQTRDRGFALVGIVESFNQNNRDIALIRVANNGRLLWSKSYGGEDDDIASVVVQTTDGGFAIAGRTESFGSGQWDFWLIRTDENGDSLWSKTYGGQSLDLCFDLIQTENDGFVLAGYTESFGAGWQDFWIVKTDQNGDSLWSRTIGGEEQEWCSSIIQTSDGGFILGGSTSSFGAGSTDYWLVRLAENGDSLWSKTFGGAGQDECEAIILTPENEIVMGGNTTSFGAGEADFWLVKTTPDPVSVSDSPIILLPSSFIISSFPSPFNSTAIVSFQTPFTGDVRASLVDGNGRELRKYWIPAFAGMMNHGSFNVDGSGLTAGTYWLRFEQNGRAATQRLSLVK